VASGDLRFFFILQILAQHHVVDIFALHPDLEPPELDQCKEKLRGIGINVLEGDQKTFELATAQRIYNVALFEFWHSAEWAATVLRRQQPWVHIIVDSVDLHFLREEAGLDVGISDKQTVSSNKEKELKVYKQADTVLVVTPEDQSHLKIHGIGSSTERIPNIMLLHSRPEQKRAHELIFIGGFRHAPNVDGILWFTNTVWPSVRAKIPDATLTIVGSYATPEVQQLAERLGVNFVGFVPDTKPYLDRAYLSIAPLRFGAGMKGKVTEAMAAGLPVVTTTFGAQGLEAVPGTHLIVADEASEFAAQVVNLLNDEKRAQKIGAAGQVHIQGICSYEIVERRLRELLDTVQSDNSLSTSIYSYRIIMLYLYKVRAYLKMWLRPVKMIVKFASS